MCWELESAINAIPADKFWKTLCVKWTERMHRCIAANSQYFKKEPDITDANLNDDDRMKTMLTRSVFYISNKCC